jgi:putative DNA primase/helicase
VTAYGTAGPAFVQKLIDEKLTGGDIRASVDEFIKLVGVGQAHGQVRRVAMKAGLSAVAGELAIAFGIVPWASGSAVAASEYVFQLWLERRGTAGSYELMEALQRVQAIFEQYGDSRFDPLRLVTAEDPADPFDPVAAAVQFAGEPDLVRFDSGRSPTLKRLGWTSGVGEGRRWYLAPQTWKDEIGKGFDLKALNSELEKLGALELATRADGARIRKRPKQVMIAGVRNHYYIVNPKIFQVVSNAVEEASNEGKI